MPIFDIKLHRRAVTSGDDVPEQRPSVEIPLDHVGIGGTFAWIDTGKGPRPYEVEVGVALPADKRGIHMSRIREVISRLADTRFRDVAEYAEEAALQVAQVQASRTATVSVKGREPVETVGEVSGIRGIEAREIGASATVSSGRARRFLWMKADHITACPCTQEYSRLLVDTETASSSRAHVMPTHSQRSTTSLKVEDAVRQVGFADLAACLAEALHLTNDLLKRPDEAELVYRAHLHPQFAEDVVREVAAAVLRRLGDRLPGTASVEVESVSLESIHSHNVICRLSSTIAALSGATR